MTSSVAARLPAGRRLNRPNRRDEGEEMGTTITETLMTSDVTAHRATRDAVEKDWWWVTWLPKHRVCDRNEAITAMTLAEFVAQGVTPGHRLWPHVQNFAIELNLSAEQAVALVATTIINTPREDAA